MITHHLLNEKGICKGCGKDFSKHVRAPYSNAYEAGFYICSEMPSKVVKTGSIAILSCMNVPPENKPLIVYIAHPIGGDVKANLLDLQRIIRKINLAESVPVIIPFCPYYADVVSLDDSIPEQRDRGIHNNTHILRSGIVDMLWLTGTRISFGMQQEIHLCQSLGIRIEDHINKF